MPPSSTQTPLGSARLTLRNRRHGLLDGGARQRLHAQVTYGHARIPRRLYAPRLFAAAVRVRAEWESACFPFLLLTPKTRGQSDGTKEREGAEKQHTTASRVLVVNDHFARPVRMCLTSPLGHNATDSPRPRLLYYCQVNINTRTGGGGCGHPALILALRKVKSFSFVSTGGASTDLWDSHSVEQPRGPLLRADGSAPRTLNR